MIMGRAFLSTKWRPSPVSFCRRSRSSTRAQKGRLSLKNGRPNKTQRNPKTSKTTKISKTAQAERITAMRSVALIAALQLYHSKRKIRTNLQLGRLRSDYSVLVRVTRFERAISTSQMWRGTNSATPGYSVFCHYTTLRAKIKVFPVCGQSCGQSRFSACFHSLLKSRKRPCCKVFRASASRVMDGVHRTPKHSVSSAHFFLIAPLFIR